MTIEKLRPSFTFDSDRLRELAGVVPEAFADDKINWDTLREALGEHLEDETQEHFGLFWPGKREARRLAAMPSKGTLVPQPGQGVDEDTTHNLFIEGDNLEVLKLLQKSYAGRVKMIYIDPPYNTGNDYVYQDDYSELREAYFKRTGAMDEEGRMLTTNSRASGRFHSNWLNMIYPRLLAAWGLLSSNGVIFVSIDDNEIHHLRALMGEVFGEENFVAQIPWQSRQSVQNDTDISINHEYIVCYAKSRRASERRLKETNAKEWYSMPSFAAYPLPLDPERFSNPDNDSRGPWKADPFDAPNIRPNLTYAIINPKTHEKHWPPAGRCWRMEEPKYKDLLADDRIIFGKTGDSRPQLKVFYNEKVTTQPIKAKTTTCDEKGRNCDYLPYVAVLNVANLRQNKLVPPSMVLSEPCLSSYTKRKIMEKCKLLGLAAMFMEQQQAEQENYKIYLRVKLYSTLPNQHH
ncbi:MAG: site-specific DNA-methyltransferase [Chloroflexota bacterium]